MSTELPGNRGRIVTPSMQDVVDQSIREHLRIQIADGNFGDQNTRHVKLIYKGEIIDRAEFDVVQKED